MERKEITRIVFVAKDGKEFDNEARCKQYEEALVKKNHLEKIEHKMALIDIPILRYVNYQVFKFCPETEEDIFDLFCSFQCAENYETFKSCFPLNKNSYILVNGGEHMMKYNHNVELEIQRLKSGYKIK